jgi:Ca2+/H+ antiporter
MSFLFEKYYQIRLGLKRLPNLLRNSILAGIMACLLAIVGFSMGLCWPI